MDLFHTYLYQPIFNLLIWLYNVIPGADFGFAIIALTVIIKTALWPLTHASLKSQKRMQELQPKLEALKKEFKDDKEGLSRAMMQLYSSEKVNPLGSCLPLLIQLPIIIALFQVLREGMISNEVLNQNLYSFIWNPGEVNHYFLGFQDLSQKSLPLAFLAGAFQFIQTKMLMAKKPPKDLRHQEGAKDESMMAAMNQSMLYFMPVVTVVIGASFPAGLTLYWAVMNMVTILQQLVAFSKKKEDAGNGQTKIENKEGQFGNAKAEIIDAEFTDKPSSAESGSPESK